MQAVAAECAQSTKQLLDALLDSPRLNSTRPYIGPTLLQHSAATLQLQHLQCCSRVGRDSTQPGRIEDVLLRHHLEDKTIPLSARSSQG
jgi:hypothetical protein